MKNDLCCTESSCQSGKWFTAICAIVGFVGMATVLTLWLCKKYRKCTAAFHDDGSLDCDDCCNGDC